MSVASPLSAAPGRHSAFRPGARHQGLISVMLRPCGARQDAGVRGRIAPARRKRRARPITIIIDDSGWHREAEDRPYVRPSDLAAMPGARDVEVLLKPDDEVEALRPWLVRLSRVCIEFGRFADLRGYASAMALRQMGFAGRLRAAGNVLASHYTIARRAGFDEVALTAAQANRQKPEHWRFVGNWRQGAPGSRGGS
jgi:uncharacterized protein (DUF934 family)